MVGRAVSQAIRKQRLQAAKHLKLSEALKAYRKAQENGHFNNGKPSLRRVASHYKVALGTLHHAVTGGRTMMEFAAAKQKLTPAEEVRIVDYLLESADRGLPKGRDDIIECANAILRERLRNTKEKVGKDWVDRFLRRHEDILSMHWSKPLDTLRAQAVNPRAISHWFELVELLVVKQNIPPQNIYGMDESGFQLSFQTKKRVVGRKGAKIQHKQGASDRENVTVLVTICADGSRLHPTIIFKGANFMTKWSNNNVANASFCHSTNGWIDTDLAVAWFLKDFLPTIRAKSGDETVFVFVDSQVTHLSLKLLRTAAENNVQFLAYPTRATHALQGLDVVCFAPMKDIYHDEVKKFTELHGRKVSKSDFAGVFGTAYLRALTEDLVKAAFRSTGIYPFDPSAISASQMKPSEPTSILGSFPTEQPSPVKAVAKAFRDRPLTELDIEDLALSGNETLSTQEDRNGALALEEHNFRPQSPTLVVPQQRDGGNDEPAARIRILASNLAGTKSGAYLVSKDVVRASQPVPSLLIPRMAVLPEPNWSLLRKRLPVDATREELEEHIAMLQEGLKVAEKGTRARNKMMESDRALLIIQDLHLQKQQAALHIKTGAAKAKSRKMKSDGLGRHLTGHAYIEERENFEKEKRREKRAKSKRKKDRDLKKIAKDSAEVKWKTYFANYKQDEAAWRTKCRGLPKSRQPTKPTRLLKPKFISNVVEEELKRLRDEDTGGGDDTNDEGEESEGESEGESFDLGDDDESD